MSIFAIHIRDYWINHFAAIGGGVAASTYSMVFNFQGYIRSVCVGLTVSILAFLVTTLIKRWLKW